MSDFYHFLKTNFIYLKGIVRDRDNGKRQSSILCCISQVAATSGVEPGRSQESGISESLPLVAKAQALGLSFSFSRHISRDLAWKGNSRVSLGAHKENWCSQMAAYLVLPKCQPLTFRTSKTMLYRYGFIWGSLFYSMSQLCNFKYFSLNVGFVVGFF